MRDNGVFPDIITYSVLLDALCKWNHLDEAIALFKRIVDQGIEPDVYMYNILIDGLCKGGRLNIAHKVFQHLLANR